MVSIDYPPCWVRLWRWLKSLRRRIGNFERWTFPVIKNMDNKDVIDALMSVQPMKVQPASSLYFDFVRKRAKTPWYARMKVWVFGSKSKGCRQ